MLLESACKGRGSVCVFGERGRVYREIERDRERERDTERWKVCAERGKGYVLK